MAVLLQLIHLFGRAQLETLKQERRFQPRPIKLGDIHATLQITNIDSLYSLSHNLGFQREVLSTAESLTIHMGNRERTVASIGAIATVLAHPDGMPIFLSIYVAFQAG
ncbi:MAG: hypothetical protein R3268_10505 [Acidiferrobacterales bacterium]|nr:hypothetical protein [Acidiferrobacterales bacterium]